VVVLEQKFKEKSHGELAGEDFTKLYHSRICITNTPYSENVLHATTGNIQMGPILSNSKTRGRG
jgi:hypothetical protein